jgi:cancer susceptibility candidate protein 1
LKQLELEAAKQREEARRRAELKKLNEEREHDRLEADRCDSVQAVPIQDHISTLVQTLIDSRRRKAEHLILAQQGARQDHLSVISAGEQWNRYISCNPLPIPTNDSSLREFLASEAARVPESVEEAVVRMQGALSIIQELNAISIWLEQLGKDHSTLLQRKEQLFKLVSQISDMATAFFLHRCDYFADEDGGIRFEHKMGPCTWGIWLNVHKNPRTKMVEFPRLNINFEIQKQVALAPVAIRVQILPTVEEFNDVCMNELMAVGPVISLDLLALPPTSKPTVRQWVIRLHGPLTNAISKIPYPIPPAGADPYTWTSDEDIAPLTVTVDVKPKLVQLVQQDLQVLSTTISGYMRPIESLYSTLCADRATSCGHSA